MFILLVSMIGYMTFAEEMSQEAEDAAILREVYGKHFQKLGRSAEEIETALSYLEKFILEEDDEERMHEEDEERMLEEDDEEDHMFAYTDHVGADYRQLLENEPEWTHEEFDALLSEINEHRTI